VLVACYAVRVAGYAVRGTRYAVTDLYTRGSCCSSWLRGTQGVT